MKMHPLPEIPYIGDGAENLYAAEETRNTAIRRAAAEHGKLLGHAKEQFWTHTMPEQLASILENYERAASIAAALGYLQQFGNITFEPEDGSGIIAIPMKKKGRKA